MKSEPTTGSRLSAACTPRARRSAVCRRGSRRPPRSREHAVSNSDSHARGGVGLAGEIGHKRRIVAPIALRVSRCRAAQLGRGRGVEHRRAQLHALHATAVGGQPVEAYRGRPQPDEFELTCGARASAECYAVERDRDLSSAAAPCRRILWVRMLASVEKAVKPLPPMTTVVPPLALPLKGVTEVTVGGGCSVNGTASLLNDPSAPPLMDTVTLTSPAVATAGRVHETRAESRYSPRTSCAPTRQTSCPSPSRANPEPDTVTAFASPVGPADGAIELTCTALIEYSLNTGTVQRYGSSPTPFCNTATVHTVALPAAGVAQLTSVVLTDWSAVK
eukprot:2761183-Prymnesium_polylepis.1